MEALQGKIITDGAAVVGPGSARYHGRRFLAQGVVLVQEGGIGTETKVSFRAGEGGREGRIRRGEGLGAERSILSSPPAGRAANLKVSLQNLCLRLLQNLPLRLLLLRSRPIKAMSTLIPKRAIMMPPLAQVDHTEHFRDPAVVSWAQATLAAPTNLVSGGPLDQ